MTETRLYILILIIITIIIMFWARPYLFHTPPLP